MKTTKLQVLTLTAVFLFLSFNYLIAQHIKEVSLSHTYGVTKGTEKGNTLGYFSTSSIEANHGKKSEKVKIWITNQQALHIQPLQGSILETEILASKVELGALNLWKNTKTLVKGGFGGLVSYDQYDASGNSALSNIHYWLTNKKIFPYPNPYIKRETFTTLQAMGYLEKKWLLTPQRNIFVESINQFKIGGAIPLQKNSVINFPLRVSMETSLTLGILKNNLPILYGKVGMEVSNEPFHVSRDMGTLGSYIIEIGSKFFIGKKTIFFVKGGLNFQTGKIETIFPLIENTSDTNGRFLLGLNIII